MTRNKDKFITPLAPRQTFRQWFFEFKTEKKYLLLCFAVPMFIMLLMYICFEVYPIGNGSVLVLDLNGQYVYFFEGLRDILKGDGSLLYSFSRALGGEFVGIFAYYLSSPFSLIVCLFPAENITEALLLMFLLKTGACGLTFGIFIEKTRKVRNRTATVLFATMYALCGYCVVMQHNTMWIDNVILLPIIMIGIDNLISYGKYRLFVIALTMAVVSNFYIGYMTCILCAVYFFYSYFSRTVEERNPRGERLHFLKSLGRMALFSAISIGICAALLWGTYYSLCFGKTTFSNPNFSPEQRFDWLDCISKLFIGSYDTVRPEGLPFIYSGTLTLILAPLYFFAPHIKVREKVASGIITIFFLASFNVSTIDLVWHGMQKPNWLNYRYSYMLCFFLILFAYKAYEKLREIGYTKAIVSSALWAVVLLVVQKMDFEWVDDFTTIWLSLAIIAVYLCVLRASSWSSDEVRSLGTLILAILVGAEMFGGGLLNMNSLGEDVVYSSRSSYRTFIDGLRPSVNNVLEADDTFYRMEKTDHRKTNDNFALNMNGLSNSTSTLNQETISLLHDFGISSKSHWTKYLGGNPVTETLLGVKYMITKSEEDEIMELYTETEYGEGDYIVWNNPYALSIAYGVNKGVEDLEIHESYNSPFERLNALVASMINKDHGVHVFKKASYVTDTGGDLQVTTVAGHTKYAITNENGYNRVTYTIKVESEEVLYCYFPTEFLREAYLYVNGLKEGGVFGNETDRIIELGSFEVGDVVEISLEPIDEYFYTMNDECFFYYLNSSDFEKYMPLLKSSEFEINSYNDDYFEGTITISEGNELVFTSIPYDEGWKVYLDGEQVKVKELISGVIGFDADVGEHTLVMKYRPDYLKYGITIQIVSLMLFVSAWVVDSILRKKRIAAGYAVFDGVLPDDDIVEPEQDAFEALDAEIIEEEKETPEELLEQKVNSELSATEDVLSEVAEEKIEETETDSDETNIEPKG